MSFFQKIEKYIFYIFVFSIPFQIRVFIYEWGAPKDEFFSAFFYLTDAFLIALFIFWLISKRRIVFCRHDIYLLSFFVFAFISVLQMEAVSFGFYQFLKLVEFSLLYFYIKSNSEISLNSVFYVFVFSGVFQALLGIFQFFSQSNLGLKYLGETILSPDMPGVAKIDTESGKVMRAYGTFTHPNVLSAYLFLSISFFYYLLLEKIKVLKWNHFLILFVLFFGLFLTFSRSAILVFFVFLAILFFKFKGVVNIKKATFFLVFLSVFFSSVFFDEVSQRANVVSDVENLNFRGIYEDVAKEFIIKNPFFGVGAGNFVNSSKNLNLFFDDMVWAYQPVHNVYLLISSELGVFAFVSFFLFFSFLILALRKSKHIKNKDIVLLGVMFSISLLFLIDHYFWSFQQGRLMLWFVFGVVALRAFQLSQKNNA